MSINKTQLCKQSGSALILVVVVTVLLSVVGVMFVMVSRASELETAAVIQSKNLESAVNTVVERINSVLVDDLFSGSGFDPNLHDAVGINDFWLSALEPTYVDAGTPTDATDDRCHWSQVTDLWNYFGGSSQLLLDDGSGVVGNLSWTPQDPFPASFRRADADGDGVADSRWVPVRNLTTSRGEPVFAAVRIIDNCAMLNLNVASNFFGGAIGSVGEGVWDADQWFRSLTGNPYYPTGRYLSEINYRFFLRGADRDLANVIAIEEAKVPAAFLFEPKQFHDALIMNIENPPQSLTPFDISDELEIRNRYLLTALPICRFENEEVAYETFDRGRGQFGGGWDTAIRVKRIPIVDDTDFLKWKRRLSHIHSDAMSGNENDDYYDRRHLCTFYSFDRPLPKAILGLLESEIQIYANDNYEDAGFSSSAEYQEFLRDIFAPKGTVTTNIESPVFTAAPYNNIETRRKILHLLFALKEYFFQQGDFGGAPRRSAQVVANIIDFSDGNFGIDPAVVDDPKDYGPFYDGNGGTVDYGGQSNLDCTFITEAIIRDMIEEVSGGLIPVGKMSFGLDSEIVFGYERQPFITEISVEWDGTATPNIKNIAIELVNPYYDEIDLTGWKLKIGSSYDTGTELDGKTIPAADGLINKTPGRLVVYNGSTPYANNIYPYNGNDHGTRYIKLDSSTSSPLPLNWTRTDDNSVALTRPAPTNSGETEIIVDRIADEDYDNNSDLSKSIFKDATVSGPGFWTADRTDSYWSFIRPEITITENGQTVGSDNTPGGNDRAFQLTVPDDGEPVSRWGDIELLSLFGNPSYDIDPNNPITAQIGALTNITDGYIDLLAEPKLLDYISPMNRPDYSSLPGRININTAPLHVIAAALPPSLVRTKSNPNTAVTLAEMIIAGRPYKDISELQNLNFFSRFENDTDNIFFSEGPGYRHGDDQLIMDDIEERDWFLTHLANKFTVRSDVFTAYILVQLGTDGPQRRMIAIFDRSQVWDKDDRPKLVALHPVPDPR